MKAKHIIEACQAILDRFNGKIPRNLDALVSLPGVGRKTANCVLGGAYGIQTGIVVDTHVIRLSNRLGLTKNDDPLKIEEDLMKIVEEKDWYRFSNLLILHGRRTCKAKKPLCEKCKIFDLCPSYSKLSKLTKHSSRNK
jgi:endonuclease-3